MLTYALARSRETLTLHSLAEAEAMAFTRNLQTEIDKQLRDFRRFKWNALAGRYNGDQMKMALIEFQKNTPYFYEVGEANAKGELQWAWPEKNSQIPRDLSQHEEWKAALKQTKDNGRDITAVWLDKLNNAQFLAMVMPLSL